MTDIETLLDGDAIARRIEEMAGEIATAWPGETPKRILMVVVLKGAFIFAADLARALSRAGARVRVEFLTLSSYGRSMESSGEVTLRGPTPATVQGRDVLLVEDILDSGRSIAFARQLLTYEGAASVRTCVLLDKPERRATPIEGDFVGFRIPDRFVVGYGLDHGEDYRDLPFVGVVTGG